MADTHKTSGAVPVNDINPEAESAELEAAEKSAEQTAETVEKEPAKEKKAELPPPEPRVPIIPAVQYSKSLERERKIAEEVRKRRRRPMMFTLICCALLIVVAIVVNAVRKDNKPAPAPTAAVQTQPFTPATPAVLEVPKEHSYELVLEDVTWRDAREICMEKGGYHAVITDLAEYDRIIALAEEAGIQMLWVGCHRVEGELKWVTGEEADYMPWANGEPSGTDPADGAAEDHVMLWKNNGTWLLNDCRNDPVGTYPGVYGGRIGYICEFENR